MSGRELTENMRTIVRLSTLGHNQQQICHLTGFDDGYLSRTIRLPHVQAAIRAEMYNMLETGLVPASFKALLEIIQGEHHPAAARVQASRAVLQAAGYIDRERKKDKDADKTLLQMSTEELRDELAKLERELGNRAHLVMDSAQLPPPAPSQAFDVFE